MMTPCILIPIYNHKDTIAAVLAQIAPFRRPCVIVNDGSDAATRHLLETQQKQRNWVRVIHLPDHQGKGAAVQAGLLHASAMGYSHAVLIDADGQHNAQDIPKFLAEAAATPTAVILGKPRFGAEAPKSRLRGRKISQFWVRIETLSRAIGDPLCGFRVYPVASAVDLIRQAPLGNGMEFDTEIAVRLYWAGVPMRNVDTTVTYPEGGLSHFRVWHDNLRISWLHTRLCCGTLPRIPRLLRLYTTSGPML
jgi:glycosyltransferase involved in cell wall biosynthesis